MHWGKGMLAAMAAAALAGTAEAQSGGMIITTDGMLGVRAGMTHRQVAILINRRGTYGEAACDMFETRNGLGHVMVESGVVTRIDTSSPQLSTPSGARVGMTEAALRRMYGRRLRRSNNEYSGYDYLLTASNGNAILFHTDKGRIEEIRAGRQGSVQYSEGCS